MSWFNKRSERNVIPPVEQEPAPGYKPSSRAPSYRSTLSSGSTQPNHSTDSTDIQNRGNGYYVSRDPSSMTSGSQSLMDKYQRNRPVGDMYSRGQGNIDQDRNELFAGYNPNKSQSGRFVDGPRLGREPPPGEENDEDVEGIKQQTRFLKQESVNSTRNALRLAREAEETARTTMGRLGDQSEKLSNTERHIDVAKGHSQHAADKADELKQLNRSIFRPVITFNKDAKRAAKAAEVQRRYDDDRDERERTMTDLRETKERVARSGAYGQADDEEGIGRRGLTASQQAMRKEQRKRYQFEATASDDEMEDELDNNLDEISDVAKRLKALAVGMGQEVDRQNDRIDRIAGKADDVDRRVFSNTEKLKRIK